MSASPQGRELPFPLSQSLCARCGWGKRVESERGSVFLMCRRASRDSGFERYPLQPVISCTGHEEPGEQAGLGDAGG